MNTLVSILAVFGLLEVVKGGHFQCRDKCDNRTNTLLNLEPLVSLENLCLDVCKESNCTSQLDPVTSLIGGPAECLTNSKGNNKGGALSPLQACFFPCILNLNVLEVCDVSLIVSRLLLICPNIDVNALCVSACLCCSIDDDPLALCVPLCLSNIKKGPSSGLPSIPDLPIVGNPKILPTNKKSGEILPGLKLDLLS